MKTVKNLTWEYDKFSKINPGVSAYKSKKFRTFVKGFEGDLGYYRIHYFKNEQKKYFLSGGVEDLYQIPFDTLTEAKEYAQKHFEKELEQYLPTLTFKWRKGIDDWDLFDSIVIPSMRVVNEDLIPQYFVESKAFPIYGYYIFARPQSCYYYAEDAIGRADTEEEAQKKVERWYKRQLIKLFYNE
ncbi:hypothetical protein [Bacteroides pyogenes]|uniref:hypothetical protein n=1 Tax=Bacteroides pyogenes TaxID=310300 RepID=UPI003FA03D8B